MKLELEVCGAEDEGSLTSVGKTFERAGGVIGRGAGCDWVIPDGSRLLSSHHGLIAFREGQYFLTDISSNGISVVGSAERLRKGQARLIDDGDEFRLGSLVIRAHLVGLARPDAAHGYRANDSIPDDAFLALDPIQLMDSERRHQMASRELDALSEPAVEHEHCLDHRAVDREHAVLPRRAEPVQDAPSRDCAATSPVDAVFWTQFAAALGIPLQACDSSAREALAIKVARLLRLGVEGLQQSMRTCEELKTELNLPLFDARLNSLNPLKDCPGTDAALAAMLGVDRLGQLSAEQAVRQVQRDLQAHQVALLAACRSSVRTTRTAFAPDHLLTCFHYQEKKPWFSTGGGHWRAYQRHYRRVIADSACNDPLRGGDFAKAYEEQVRLISTLHADFSG
ncbi:type VI secretion protein [Pseudomonas fluorescens]|uniref:Type VI secretion protein n=1 Tax=Pseudomonas fluorescens TaxID=294 RepID=A0A1T2XZF3_PSEFL|nr:type VI secretion system-associated FHA domain protein TagH [Pseudomonas fluorescens]OPA85212.1 type VI secretion protein [Pseudomonas fluorescens]